MSPAVCELLCQQCGREYCVWATLDHGLWNAVAATSGDPPIHFLCMDCFADIAERFGLVESPCWIVSVEGGGE